MVVKFTEVKDLENLKVEAEKVINSASVASWDIADLGSAAVRLGMTYLQVSSLLQGMIDASTVESYAVTSRAFPAETRKAGVAFTNYRLGRHKYAKAVEAKDGETARCILEAIQTLNRDGLREKLGIGSGRVRGTNAVQTAAKVSVSMPPIVGMNAADHKVFMVRVAAALNVIGVGDSLTIEAGVANGLFVKVGRHAVVSGDPVLAIEAGK